MGKEVGLNYAYDLIRGVGMIESLAERIAIALERIADALEGKASHRAEIPASPQTTIDDSDSPAFLDGISTQAVEAWRKAYGAELVRDELPKAEAGWLSDDFKQRTGSKSVYIRHWLQNAARDRAKAPPPTPTIPKPLVTNEAVERIQREEAAVDANPPDPTVVRALIRQIIG